ncbi:MAG: ornithine cyclodeaminase family protein, partial [Clostridia bacterium]|nr:ornithine cyclodeaminase family protein [Clostridia bacterium]
KWVSVFPNNPSQFGIQNVSGIIILSSVDTGFPFAVMDGTLITALRTACVGAIGAKYLARKDASVYGSIGAGEEAVNHFKLIKRMVPAIKRAYVASRTSNSENKFIERLSPDYADVEFIQCDSDYRKASRDADIIVTAVSCQSPLLKADAIKPGAYYCHVGGWEDEYDVVRKADKIVCDNWEALKHRGSPTLARLYKEGGLKNEDIYCNLDELICGLKPGRESPQEFIYFNSIGLAFVDVAVAYSFYKKAIEKGRYKQWIL